MFCPFSACTSYCFCGLRLWDAGVAAGTQTTCSTCTRKMYCSSAVRDTVRHHVCELHLSPSKMMHSCAQQQLALHCNFLAANYEAIDGKAIIAVCTYCTGRGGEVDRPTTKSNLARHSLAGWLAVHGMWNGLKTRIARFIEFTRQFIA